MKRKYSLWILLGLLALVTAFSCKSAPETTEETPPVETPAAETTPVRETPPARDPGPDQAALDALDSAANRAGEAKKLISDFNGSVLFPEDWNSADALLAQAERQRNLSTRSETEASTARYNSAAAAFEAMRDKTFAAYYAEKEKELNAARAAAVDARAPELAPDYLLSADNAVLDSRTKYEARDYYGAKDAADKSLYMYTALTAGLNAYAVREEIAARNFEVYDPANTERADNTLRSAAGDYEAQDFASAREKSGEALAAYRLLLENGWRAYSAEKGEAASAERQKALDLKANVAVREEYNAAQTVFVRAVSAFQEKRYSEAAGLYDECVSTFGVISQAALEKRQAAEAALQRANEKMTESDETARNAEVILEGGAE